MAATALASAADAYTIPDWVERNSQLFRECPPGVHRSTRSARTNAGPVVKSEADDDGKSGDDEEEVAAACMAATLINTDHGVGWIDSPSGLQPASYYRDLSNHPNILATFVFTARRKANFLPTLMGQQLSQEQWTDFLNKFNAWLNELDAFWYYLTWTSQEAGSILNEAGTSDVIVDTLSEFVVKATEEGVKEEVTERVKRHFELAAEYMVEKNITSDDQGSSTPSGSSKVVKAGFQHEAFGSPSATSANPVIPISLTTTHLSKSTQNKNSSSITYNSTTMSRFTFQLNSATIVANAEALSKGTTLTNTKAYCDYINAPLNQWAAPTQKPKY